jgi:hypothetical protein
MGNADSPPGPLQNSLKETELTDWRTIDWAAVTAAPPMQEAEMSKVGVSWTTARATGFDGAFGDALLDSGRDYGRYGLLCLYPVYLLCFMRLRLRLRCVYYFKTTSY